MRHRVTNALFVPAMLQFLLRAARCRRGGLRGAALDRLRRLADHRRGARSLDEDLPLPVHPGLRPHRDHRRHHRARPARPRPGRAARARSCAPRASRTRGSRCGSSTRRRGRDRAARRGRRALDALGAEHEGLLEQARGDGRAPSRRTAGSRPATPASSDADGYLFLHDRVKDMIVSGGENVYPAEVENALSGHPDIADVAVIGVPHDKWGETVKAIVVRRPAPTRRRGAHRLRPGAARPLQVPDVGGLPGRAAAQPVGQAPQAPASRALLERARAPDPLSPSDGRFATGGARRLVLLLRLGAGGGARARARAT